MREEKEKAIYVLIDTVKAAITTYDKSGDHRHTSGDDCIRCKLVEALGYVPIKPDGTL
jgi:hypothetical protein